MEYNDPIRLEEIETGLTHVAEEWDQCPIKSLDCEKLLGTKAMDWIEEELGSRNLEDVVHELPIEAFRKMGTAGAAKAMCSNKYSINPEVERTLEKDPTLGLVSKIKSSAWRWGMERIGWNEIVDAVNGISRFNLEHPDFEITLDWTTGRNECGYCRRTRTWSDGVFAYIVSYKKTHVMTIGFSIVGGRKVLLQQIQNKTRSGNRWMFKLPANRLEHVIACFQKAFTTSEIYVANGADYALRSLKDYQQALERQEELAAKYTEEAEERREAIESLKERIIKVRSEIPRLKSFYRNTGRFVLNQELKIMNLSHYRAA